MSIVVCWYNSVSIQTHWNECVLEQHLSKHTEMHVCKSGMLNRSRCYAMIDLYIIIWAESLIHGSTPKHKLYKLSTLTLLKAHNDTIWKDCKLLVMQSGWTLPVKSSGRDKCLTKKSVTSFVWPIMEFPLHWWLSAKNRKIIRLNDLIFAWHINTIASVHAHQHTRSKDIQ